MELEIKCFASLAEHSPPGGILRAVPEKAAVGQVMDMLGIARDDVKIIFINGTHADAQTELKDGDRLGLFPAVGGG